MKKSELLEKLKSFKAILEERKNLYDHPDKNIKELENQRKKLYRLLAILNPYIDKYSLGRIEGYPLRGIEWDIYLEAIQKNKGDPTKGDPISDAIMDLEGIIAKVEAEAKEKIDIVEDKNLKKKPIERDRKIKIFLSYSNMDKELAGQIKFALEDYEIEVFLAHEDIEPSAEWEDAIRAKLESCDIFMPILTEHFYKSNWTDQEIGIAIAYNKKIMPIKLSVDPHGFISRYQALKIDINNIKTSCHELIKVISSHPKLRSLFRNALIKKFGDSNTFENAAHNTDLLIYFSGYTPNQVTAIIKHTISNRQIYESFKSCRKLRNLIYDYKEQIDAELLEAFYDAIKPKVRKITS